MLLESAFHWLFCLKFSCKLVLILRIMQENKVDVFFLKTCSNVCTRQMAVVDTYFFKCMLIGRSNVMAFSKLYRKKHTHSSRASGTDRRKK